MSINSRRHQRSGRPGTNSSSGNLETFDYPAQIWPEGSNQAGGRYNVVWSGGGTVQITNDGLLQMESTLNPSGGGWGDTASSLLVSNNLVGDFDVSVKMRTLAQLRNEAVPAGSRGTPNNWEVAWFGWHFTRNGSDMAFYYLTLKPNGCEIGKVDQRLRNSDSSYALPGGQRFLYTNSTPYPIGHWYRLRVTQTGNTINAWVDDVHVATVTDAASSNPSNPWVSGEGVIDSGGWVYYHEDARVQFDDGPLVNI